MDDATGMGGAIFAQIELSTGGLKTDAETAKRAMDEAAKSAGGLETAVLGADGKLRDAKGRFVSMGGAAKQQATDTDTATKAFAAYASRAETAAAGSGKMAVAAAGASKAKINLGQAALEASRGLEDLALGGINGVINNIPGLVSSLGGTAGLTAAISVASVVAFKLGQYALPAIADALGLTKKAVDPLETSMERLKDRIKELSDNPLKLQVDRNELQAAEADLKRLTIAQEAYNEARGAKNKYERASEAAATEAITEAEGGAKGVENALLAPRVTDAALAKSPVVASQMAKVEKARKQMGQLERGGKWEEAAEKQKELDQLMSVLPGLRDKAIAAAKDEVGKLLAAGGFGGKGAAGEVGAGQARLAEELRKTGQGRLADVIENSSPAAIKRQQAAESEFEATEAEDKIQRDKDAAIRRNPVGPGRKERDDRDKQEFLDRQREDATAERERAANQKQDDRAIEQERLDKMTPAQRRLYNIQKHRAAADAARQAGGNAGAAPDLGAVPPRVAVPDGVPVADNGSSAALLRVMQDLLEVNRGQESSLSRMARDGIVGVLG